MCKNSRKVIEPIQLVPKSCIVYSLVVVALAVAVELRLRLRLSHSEYWEYNCLGCVNKLNANASLFCASIANDNTLLLMLTNARH
jgi:rRNA maturation endonuclease Nob1